ncbi:MAG: radical SAM protein [Deltaproteobacteria bacterium]|nr:radical SAM protein [Deltaproteobacteria bacterium]
MRRVDTTGVVPIFDKGESSRVDVRLLVEPPPWIEPAPGLRSLARKLAPAFYLDVGNVCNQRCLYCAVPREKLYRTTLTAALDPPKGAVLRGFSTVALIGGEPTIWPHLHAALSRLPELGVSQVIVTTNGLMLAYEAELDRMLASGVSVFGVSLDDFDPQRQRRLSLREDNPELLERAVGHLSTADADTYFYTVVTSELCGRGEWFGRQAASVASRFKRTPAFFLAALKPLEEAARQADRLELSLGDAIAEVRGVARGLRRDDGPAPTGQDGRGGPEGRGRGAATLAVRDFPLCTLGELLPHSMDLLHRNAPLDLDSGRVEPSCLASDRTFVEACGQCAVQAWCPAIYRTCLARFGAGGFRSVEIP